MSQRNLSTSYQTGAWSVGSSVGPNDPEGDTEENGLYGPADDSSIPTNATITSVDVVTGGTISGGSGYMFVYNGVWNPQGLTLTNFGTANFTTKPGVGAWTRTNLFSSFFGADAQHNAGITATWSSLGVIAYFTMAAPTATTAAATDIIPDGATLNGTTNPNGATSSFSGSYKFEYGLTTSYGSSTSTVSGLTGSSDVAAQTMISGLVGNTTYHYRLVALNGDNTVNGSDMTFFTSGSDATVGSF